MDLLIVETLELRLEMLCGIVRHKIKAYDLTEIYPNVLLFSEWDSMEIDELREEIKRTQKSLDDYRKEVS